MEMFTQFIIMGLGLWRVVSLLANESGPFALFKVLREDVKWVESKSVTLQNFKLYEGYTCEWCLGLWLAFPTLFAWYYLREEFVYIMAVPALSTMVIIIKYVVQTLEQLQKLLVKRNEEV